MERLPNTVLLFTTTQLILFFLGLFSGLYLSRRYGSRLDRVMSLLTPLSSLPGWFYGLFLILIFASVLRVLPYGGMVDIPPPTDRLEYALSVLRHMILPVLSWLTAYFFISSYTRRTFFLIFSSEDFVEVARAKGIPEPLIRRRLHTPPNPAPNNNRPIAHLDRFMDRSHNNRDSLQLARCGKPILRPPQSSSTHPSWSA
jgi:peptide/nickel transport system permease protein